MKKACTKCKAEKPLTTEFFQLRPQRKCGWCSSCRECNKKTSRAWKEANPERTRELSRKSAIEFYKKFPERVKASSRRRYASNPKGIAKEIIERSSKRRAFDPVYRIQLSLRSRVNKTLRGLNKSKKTRHLLGCSVEFLKGHLQAQFQPGMTWENYGSVWHADHIIPMSHFDLTLPEDQHRCFCWVNYQPLFVEDNLKKHNSFVG